MVRVAVILLVVLLTGCGARNASQSNDGASNDYNLAIDCLRSTRAAEVLLKGQGHDYSRVTDFAGRLEMLARDIARKQPEVGSSVDLDISGATTDGLGDAAEVLTISQEESDAKTDRIKRDGSICADKLSGLEDRYAVIGK